jgi:hypothetical protein
MSKALITGNGKEGGRQVLLIVLCYNHFIHPLRFPSSAYHVRTGSNVTASLLLSAIQVVSSRTTVMRLLTQWNSNICLSVLAPQLEYKLQKRWVIYDIYLNFLPVSSTLSIVVVFKLYVGWNRNDEVQQWGGPTMNMKIFMGRT